MSEAVNVTFNNSTLNFSDPRVVYPYYGNKITWTTVYSLQFFVAIIGNFLIVWIVYRDNRLKTTTNYLIANMAASDLIGGLFVYPCIITSINFDNRCLIGGNIGNALCKLTVFIIEMSFTVSINSCIAIAIDRYYAVVHPFKRPLEDKMKQAIAVIWIIAGVLNSPILYIFETLEDGDTFFCKVSDKNWSFDRIYTYVGFVFGGVLPVVFMTTTYTLTICKLYRRKVPGLSTSERRRREQQNKKVLKHAVTIVVLLYVCKGLISTVLFLNFEGKLAHLSVSQYMNLVNASLCITSFSFMYNFFVYLIFNDIYRENMKALIPKCCCRSNANRRQEIPGEMIEMQALN